MLSVGMSTALSPGDVSLTRRVSISHRTHVRMSGFVTPRSELAPRAPQPQTVTLTGCMDGVGIGLDGDNCVDMLTPGKPAAAVLQMGDRVTAWDGIELFDAAAGERRLLKEVVTAADSHTLVIERAQAAAPPLATPPAGVAPQGKAVLPSWSSADYGAKVSKPQGIDTDDDTVEAVLVAGTLLFVIVFIVAQPAVRSWF